MKHKRDFKALEKRRLKGAKLLARGMTKSEVARQLGVTRQTVAAWEQRLLEGGKESLKRSDLGRPRQLDAGQERALGKILMASAREAGYPTGLWTLPRIGNIVTQRYGVAYSTGHLWHLLRRMGFSCQKPEQRAIHRSRKVTTGLEKLDGHIAVARLPPDAPELNPVEAIRAYLKKHEIANLCLNTIGEVGQFARNRLKSMQQRPTLITAFWKQAELNF